MIITAYRWQWWGTGQDTSGGSQIRLRRRKIRQDAFDRASTASKCVHKYKYSPQKNTSCQTATVTGITLKTNGKKIDFFFFI